MLASQLAAFTWPPSSAAPGLARIRWARITWRYDLAQHFVHLGDARSWSGEPVADDRTLQELDDARRGSVVRRSGSGVGRLFGEILGQESGVASSWPPA